MINHLARMFLAYGVLLNSISLIAILYQLRILRIRIDELEAKR